MAYTKLYKCDGLTAAGADVPIGYQSINQLRDNFDWVRDLLAAEHANGPPPLPSGGKSVVEPHKVLGVHNDQRIQRAVAFIDWYTPAYAGAAQQPYIAWGSRTRAIREVYKFSTGVCFIPVREWTTFWATVTTVYDATDAVLFHSCRPYYSPAGQPNSNGIFVHAHKVVAGGYDAYDGNPFMIHLYGK